MGIDAIHLNGAMTGVQDYNSLRHQEDTKGMLNQTNFQNQFEQKVDNKLNQVQSKDNTDNQNRKFDAKEKGGNSYDGDGGQHRKQEKNEKNPVRAPYLGGGFDMKI